MGDTSGVPEEPPPTPWAFPVPEGDDDLIGVGADLAPGTLLAAYQSGLFPMPVGELPDQAVLGWWSPARRGVLPLDGLRVSRSLARSCRRFEVRVDTAFEEVISGCADGDRQHGWITAEIEEAYRAMHRLGWAHSVEAWTPEGELAGGLYGVAVGGLFAGESMFHRRPDASKVALVGLVDLLSDGLEGRLLDVQWCTPHLSSLGCVEVPRVEYLRRLRAALALPLPAVWSK